MVYAVTYFGEIELFQHYKPSGGAKVMDYFFGIITMRGDYLAQLGVQSVLRRIGDEG